MRKKNDIADKLAVVGGPGVKICGNLEMTVPTVVNCVVEGNIRSTSVVTLASEAEIVGDVNAASVIVDGAIVTGNIYATDSVWLKAGCALKGDIESALLTVDLDAVFNGYCKTTRVSEDPEVKSEPKLEPVKRTKDKRKGYKR